MGRSVTLPYKVLSALLFSEFTWIERSVPLIVVPTNKLCRQLGTTPRELKRSLEFLEVADLIKEFKWHGHYASITIRPPVGMAIMVGNNIKGSPDGT